MTIKGKCFSMCNRGQRNKSDFYQTPYSMTEQLLKNEEFKGTILEPACGEHAIYNIFTKYNYSIVGQDLTKGNNFLNENIKWDNIITNPPFRLANEFILKAKSLYRKKIAFLLPLSYLQGKTRYDLKIFNELEYVYVFIRYPLLTDKLRDDGKYNTGMQAYAWYIWNKNCKKEPIIRWIDNDKYVLRKKSRKKI